MTEYQKIIELQDLYARRIDLLWQLELSFGSERERLHQECISLQEQIDRLSK